MVIRGRRLAGGDNWTAGALLRSGCLRGSVSAPGSFLGPFPMWAHHGRIKGTSRAHHRHITGASWVHDGRIKGASRARSGARDE